jgi:glycosyltransferase involved in cell wall biosynthesis
MRAMRVRGITMPRVKNKILRALGLRFPQLAPSTPMYSIVYPSDWQTIGLRPDILIRAHDPAVDVEACILSGEDVVRYGAANAPVLERVPLAWNARLQLLAGRAQLPRNGNYVICLKNPKDGALRGASGIVVDERVDQWAQCFSRMLQRRTRLRASSQMRPAGAGSNPLFSIITTVYNTDADYLDELAGMVIDQTFADFEWLLLDNGSERVETTQAIARVASRDRRIRNFRVDANVHIIRGNRYLLERARGQFIVPIDSDDLLYPDALEILAERCGVDGAADVFFSDEQKVTPFGAPSELIWRPEWSQLFALSTCPAAHLLVYRREKGLEAGVYTEEYARGSHDWDTMLRLVDRGVRPERIPEVLYGWRMHPQSSALTQNAKDYLLASQTEVIRNSLCRRGLEHLFEFKPAIPAIGYYHLVRRRRDPKPLVVDFILRPQHARDVANLYRNLTVDYPDVRIRVLQLGRSGGWKTWPVRGRRGEWHVCGDAAALAAAVSEVPEGAFAKAIIDCGHRLESADWAWDAIGTLELHGETGIVTGPVLDRSRHVRSAGYVAGLDGFFGTPRVGQLLESIPGAVGLLRRHIMAAHSGFMVLRASVLKSLGGPSAIDHDDALHGIEYCLRARESGVLTAYTPGLIASRSRTLAWPVGSSAPSLQAAIMQRYGSIIARDPYYARYLELDSRHYGEIRSCCAD